MTIAATTDTPRCTWHGLFIPDLWENFPDVDERGKFSPSLL